jgi:hypothetical protein
MNVKSAKKPEARIEVTLNRTLGIQSYGYDNLYPQHLQAITSASGTAELCLSRYAQFVEGNGFFDVLTASHTVNRAGHTTDDLLRSCADDLTRYGGFALHVNYNILGEIVEVQSIPFEQVRLKEQDANGYVSKVVVHPDWSEKTYRNGNILRVTRQTVEEFNVFNPVKEVVQAQMLACGGVEYYNGQVLYVSIAGGMNYPVPKYDAVVTEMSTDEGLSNVKNRNVRNNFLTSCMMVARKSMHIDGNGNEEEREMISPEVSRAFQGETNAGKMLYVEIESDEDEPKVVELPVKNYDKEFTATEASTVERIYAQFHQEIFYAVRIGKLGFSGDVMREAYEYYAGQVTTEQRIIQRAMERIFSVWHDKSVALDFAIEPLLYVSVNESKA